MHNTYLIRNLLKYLETQEDETRRKIKKIHVTLSEFGAVPVRHFLAHFKEAVFGTRWSDMAVAVKKARFGPEFVITKIEFK